MSNSKVPPTKPVNDLIKFWASQQEEKDKSTSESRSPRRPLSPNASSTPSSPKVDSYFPKQPLSPTTRQLNSRDTPTTSPPLSPNNYNYNNINNNNNIIISNDDNNNVNNVNNNEFQQPINISSSSSTLLTSSVQESDPTRETTLDVARLRDPMSRKAASQMVQRDSLPRVKNVSDLVSKFEKVVSPPTSPTTKKLQNTSFTETSQPTSPKSPRPMSPIKRNKNIEPLSISQPLSDAISGTLVSQIKQRDDPSQELSILTTTTTTFNESSSSSMNTRKQSITSEPLYSPMKSSRTPSMKRRSNIPDPIVIPSPTTSTKSIRDSQLFNNNNDNNNNNNNDDGNIIEQINQVSNFSPTKKDDKVDKEESKKLAKLTKLTSPIKSIVSPTINSKLKLKPDSKSKKFEDEVIDDDDDTSAFNNLESLKRRISNLPEIRPTSDFDMDFLEPAFNNNSTVPSLPNTTISRSIVSTSGPIPESKSPKSPKSPISPKSLKSPISPKSLKSPISPKSLKSPISPKSLKSPISPKSPKSPISPKSPKSPISPKGISQKRTTISSSSNLPVSSESLPQVSFSSPSGEITTEILSERVSSSPLAQSPNLGSTPGSSIPTSPEFLSSKSAFELLPEITPISPFWNPAAATGSNTVSPLWKPLPDNKNRPISPILSPEPDNNNLSQKLALAFKNEMENYERMKMMMNVGDDNNNNNLSNTSGNKSPDLWFKKSSVFLKVPELLSQPVPTSSSYQYTMQEPLPRLSESDPTANSYIFSFLSGDQSWKFFVGSPNSSTTNLDLGLNPFTSHLDNIREDNDNTDVENEYQNYNPFVDEEQSDLSGEKKNKHVSKDSHAIEMQVTNMVHSRSTTKVDDDDDDENDPTAIKTIDNNKLNVFDSSGNLINSDDESRKTIKTKSIRSLDSIAKYKRKSNHSQHKYKPVQISKSPYSTTRPQRNTLSPEFILKENPNLLNSVPGEINALDLSVANMATDSADPVSTNKFSISPFDELEKNELFLPGTPWVHLPHLDEYIQSLPKSEFSNPREVMTSKEYEKFLEKGKKFCKDPENLFPLVSEVTDDYPNNKESTIPIKGKDENNNNNNGPSERGIPRSLPPPEKHQETFSILYEQRFLKLEIIRDFIQFMAIASLFITQGMFDNNRIYIMLSSVPNFLSLNMDKVFGFGAVFLLIFCIIGFGNLFIFRRITNGKKVTDVESPGSSFRSSLLQNHIILFILTTLYVPLTKLSLDALVWSDTFWSVKNPYLPDVDFPDFDSMVEAGDDTLRFPKDFCYVTSMKKGEMNFAPFIVALGILNLFVFTFWFPITLRRIVNTHMRRFSFVSNEVKDGEEDNNNHKFLYNGYNENWATYKSFIMAMKFFFIVLTVFVSKDNCLFRSTARQQIFAVEQSLKIVLFVIFFIPLFKSEPFIYSNFNTAEYLSRFAYLIASFIGLFMILKVGSTQGFGIGLFIINITILVIVIWYLCKEINDFSVRYKGGNDSYGISSRSIGGVGGGGGGGGNIRKKKLEFSLNISSSNLNFDKIIKERIWQDTWTKLFLTNDEFRPLIGKKLLFNEEKNYKIPYLLNFSNRVGERHVENTKILSKIGSKNYIKSLSTTTTSIFENLKLKILNNYIGVDMYYYSENLRKKTYFGKSFIIPFPFSIVICYDDGIEDEDEEGNNNNNNSNNNNNILVLTKEWEIQSYLQQNEDELIKQKRLARQMIRALEGKNVIGPCYENEGYTDKVHHHRGTLSIQRKQGPLWRENNLNQGFKVTITYSSDSTFNGNECPQIVGHDVIGITNDFKMTQQLEKLFRDNHELVEIGLNKIQKTMEEYRNYYRNELKLKESTLSYGFHINIFNNPLIPLETLTSILIKTEKNQLIQSIPEREYSTIIYLYERMRIVNTSRLHQWWYIFWEDLWRNNGKQISYLNKSEQDFSPLYRTSICYRPMERLELENFMEKRGLWLNHGKFGLFHSGVLNRIYLYLNSVVFGRKSKDGSPKKWYISKEDDNNSINDSNNNNSLLKGKGERKTIIDKVTSGISRNSYNSRSHYIMREEDSDSDFENVELDGTNNNNNVSDDETLCY